MILDGISLFVFGVLTYLGWRAGALSQVLRVVAVVAVIMLGPLVAVVARDAMFGEVDIAEPVIEVVSWTVGSSALYALIVFCGWLAIRLMRATSDTLSAMDRAGGAAIGALKATLIVYLLIAGALLLWRPLEAADPDDRLHMRDGVATAIADEVDFLSPWRLPELQLLHELLRSGKAARLKGLEAVLREHGPAADLLRRPEMQELAEDEALMKAVDGDQFGSTLADERVRQLLNDDDFVAALQEVDWKALEDALASAGESKPEPAVAE